VKKETGNRRATRKVVASPPPSKPVDAVTAQGSKDETEEQAIARTVLRPTVNAAVTLKSIGRDRENIPLNALVGALVAQCDAVNANQLDRAAGMLIAQAHTLDALFNQLVRRAALNEGQYMEAADRYYRLALRAQSQCRATLESLALIKNPPHLAFVKQANIGHAVQVNNGAAARDVDSRVRGTEIEPNKLLEHSHGQRLDFGTPSATGEADPSMEAVGGFNGAAHAGR